VSKVFISYRRDDSADATGRIYDRLVRKYGPDKVFRDVNDIPAGADFHALISQAVGRCQVLLAVIGKDWLRVAGPSGVRRLDDPDDFVRLEIEAALQRDIPVVPVLVGGAAMPPGNQLPDPLRPLARRSAIEVRRDPDFDLDVDRLVRSLDPHLQAGTPITPGLGLVLMRHHESGRNVYEAAILPALVENGLEGKVAGNIEEPGQVLNQVLEDMRSAEVIVADVYDLDTNIVYELGMCFCVRRSPILLVSNPLLLPFHLRALPFVQYETTIRGMKHLREHLSAAIRKSLESARDPRRQT
jgi:hypothetical protein